MQAWPGFFIKNPTISISIMLLLVFSGIVAYFKLPLRLFPRIDVPVITIHVNNPGMDAATVKDYITTAIQNAITAIKNINYIRSSSSLGNSFVQIFMKPGANSDIAFTQISQKIAAIKSDLPSSSESPIITKADADDNPALLLAFTSKSFSTTKLTDYLSRNVKPKISTIDGVGVVRVLGDRYAMRLWLNPIQMAEKQVVAKDVVNALHRQNKLGAIGALNGGQSQLALSIDSDFKSTDDFNRMIIKNSNGKVIRFNDIGHASLGSETQTISAFYQGQPAVMVFIKVMEGESLLTVIKKIEKAIPEIKGDLPAGVSMHEVVNAATYIDDAIKEVFLSLLESVFIVSVVIFLFLGSIRSVVIPLLAIPISIIGLFSLLYIAAFSINLLTLLAMVIAIGLVVDDAIVVMENIFRHIENGLIPKKAAFLGVREITSSIIVMTLTLSVIYMPIAFSGGISGKLFSEFALSLSGSVILSGVVALVLSPLLCANFLQRSRDQNSLSHKINNMILSLTESYVKLLAKLLDYKCWLLCGWALSILGCWYFYASATHELSPKEDAGFLQVIGSVSDADSANFLKNQSKSLIEIYQKFPEISSSIYINGIPDEHHVLSFVRLKNWHKRTKTNVVLQPLLQQQLNNMLNLKASALVPVVLPGTGGFPIEFVLKSMADYRTLYLAAQRLSSAARASGLFQFINSDLNYDQPQLRLSVDRYSASLLGISVAEINQSLSLLFSGNPVQYFNRDSQIYQVIPEAMDRFRIDPSTLNKLYIKSSSSHLIPLSALISSAIAVEPFSFNQFQKFNAVTLSAAMTPGYTVSQGLKFLNDNARRLLPRTIIPDFSGNSRQLIQEGNHIITLFVIAFIGLFIMLAMQFKNFVDPLIILCGSIPMTLLAALLPLKCGISSINIYTQLGLLTLIGLISKHAILIVTFANELRAQGHCPERAILTAGKIRLRPILMTTFAMVFGALPLLFSSGAGQVARFDIGIVIVVGMSLGTVFTLLFLPVIYSLRYKFKNYFF